MKKTIVFSVLLVSICFSQSRPSISPIKNFQGKTFEFGPRVHPVLKVERDHKAVDFLVPIGTAVIATGDGKVVQTEEIQGYGLIVRLQHDRSYRTLYAHLSQVAVKTGQRVKKGQIIAYSGNSGLSSEPHLHYEVLQNGKNMNPRVFIAQR